jgi:membrane associated rhomboid family serine protease
MRIRYNAPVTLSFALLATLVLILGRTIVPGMGERFFLVPPTMNFRNVLDYLRLFTHVAGHENWTHLMGNFALILLLGPILEEKYGSWGLFVMILITAVVTGLLNVVFLSTGLYGASGVVFMMILLISFTNIRQGEIPLTFILIVVLFLTQEVVDSLREDSVSQFAHIVGGVIGSLFGFRLSHQRSGKVPVGR